MYSPEQEKKYVSDQGGHCPNCGSEWIEGKEINIEAGTATQKVHCSACGEEWYDVYNLVGIQQIEKGDDRNESRAVVSKEL
jgi:formate dehydrogenase maturation protein FdhE